jgi:hypothetical protein
MEEGVSMIVKFIIFFGLSLSSWASESPADWVDDYQQRYPLKTDSEKLVNNTGNGFEALYGTRNVRAVLSGVLYRGGANNYYHRSNPRDNRNPLPNDGLQNLCEEGFSNAVYLYSVNYKTAPPVVNCTDIRNKKNTLHYSQISPYNDSSVKKILSMVHQALHDSSQGPIYVHCWNGWHASGLIAALALRQFCGVSGSKAVDYWNRNTDGNNKNPAYDGVKEQIRKFSAFPDLFISAELQDKICPDL